MAVLDQEELFGPAASAATADRTIVAKPRGRADRRVAGAERLAAREHAWKVGGAPPVVAAAWRGERPDEPL
ncbi:MAG: hypothetical protein ACRDYX_20120 [Egibacteraceae bacterium]